MSLSKEVILDNFKQKVIPEVLIPKYTQELRDQLKTAIPNQSEEINNLEYIYSDDRKSELIVKGDFEQRIKFKYKPKEDLNIVSKEQFYFYLRNSQKIIQVQLEEINYYKDDIIIEEKDFVKSYENCDSDKMMFIKASEFTDDEKLIIKIDEKEIILKRTAFDSAEFAKLVYDDPKNRFKIIMLIKYDFSDIKLNFSMDLIENNEGWNSSEILEVLNLHKGFLKRNIYIGGTNKIDVIETDNDRLELVEYEISNFEKIQKLEGELNVKFTIKYPYNDEDMNKALTLYKGLVLNKLILSNYEIENILISNPDFDLEENKNTKFILCQYSKNEKMELWGTKISFEYAEYIVDLEYYDYEVRENNIKLFVSEESRKNITLVLQYSSEKLKVIKDRDVLLQLN
ncbi:abortive infection system toxin AbiGii family protein [Macrococcoides caseolyticum]|uniref:abortive infection system toxin AbiGii family protein n=1 Tax=Macrococcoides caseolyticum TaxID=69966 RepID=UPI000C34EF72|nr:abortive infection system toxin AbiGii family protein [Macrococcus caseolyticus]PKD99725.1 hypothetical protein CW719_01675 [Macrococcus caseolyticus]PKF19813.1 hypothetical protein CW717_01675 [Macrococcus caseolyticus]